MVVARTVEATSRNPEVRAEAVARSVESAWATAEIEAARRGDATYRDGRDRRGPLPVMVAASLKPRAKGGEAGRLVVIGDADFAADGYLAELGNRDLVLNSISWLTDEEALIARRPREIAEIARPLSPLVLSSVREKARTPPGGNSPPQPPSDLLSQLPGRAGRSPQIPRKPRILC